MRLESPSPPPPPGCGFTLVIRNDNAPCTGFTRSEALIHGIIAMLFMFALLAPLSAAALGSKVNTVTYNILAAGSAAVAFSYLVLVVAGVMIAYDDYKSGETNELTFAAAIISLFGSFYQVVKYIIATLSLLQQIAIGAIWAGEKILTFNPGVIALLIVSVVVTFLLALDNANRDWNDGL